MRIKMCQYSRKNLLITLFFLIMGAVNVYSQCPIVTTNTQTFCDIQSPIVANLQATNNGNGIRWYATAVSTTPLSPSTGLINGEDYYADDNSGTCGTRARVDVIIYGAPTGLNFQGVCVDDPLEATISDLVAGGNDVRWYNNPNGGTALSPATILMDNTIYYADQSNPTTGCRTSRLSVFVNVGVVPVPVGDAIQEFCFDQQPVPTVADLVASGNNNWYGTISSALPLDPSTPLVDGANYYATTVDPPCESIERLEITVVFNLPNDPGSNGTVEICETDVISTQTINLIDGLEGNPMSGGNWTGSFPTTNGSTGTVDITAMTIDGSPYIFVYTVDSSTGCAQSSATVSVSITSPPNAGTNGSVTVCGNGSATNLFLSLGGTPDPGGTWSPSLDSGTGLFNPLVDAAGTYTYTVAGIPPCADASASVTVNITPPPNPGTNGSVTFCGNGSSMNLFASLSGTPDTGGTWSPALASGTGLFNPLVDAPGTYTYTVTGIPPCDDASATVTVTISPPPNAGTNGEITLCGNASPVDLFANLGGTPETGGTWTPALSSGTGIFNPLVDAGGTYTYIVTGIPPCSDASASVTVTLTPPPNAGSNGSITFCGNGSPADLFESLGGTPTLGGTWSPALASGTGLFNPLIDAAGTYTYTVTGTAPCEDASANVTVTIAPPPNAGTNGSVNFCGDGSPVDLFESLGGTPETGGTWSPALASGTGLFDPTVDGTGTYIYTVPGTVPCNDATASVTVTITPPPNAGTDGIVTFCGNGSPVDLFVSLGGTPDTGGTWSPALSSGTGLFNPLIDAEGTYIYTIAGTAPCTDASATVTVSLLPPPNAGIDGSVTLCGDATPIDLFDSLGGTPDTGGTWSPMLASGTGLFDPLQDASGTYTYTVFGASPCVDATASVTITIAPPPDAGSDGQVTFCQSGLPTDLFNSLGGSPETGGTWSPALASGTGLFNPLADAAGTYTYTVTGSNTCVASSTVTVTIVMEPNAGNDGAVVFCSNGTPMDLFNSLGGTPDVGGTWSPALASGTGLFDPLIDPAGTYTYTVDANSPCRNSSSSNVNVSVNQEPNVTGALILVENVCLGLETNVSILNATQLSDGSYTINYDLSDANISQNNSITVEFVSGSTIFTIPETLLSNPGITIITLTQFISVNSQCGADVSSIATAQFDVFEAPTPTLITDGNTFCSEESPTIQNLSANIIETETITWYDAATDGTAYEPTEPLIDGVTYYASSTTMEGCDSLIRLQVTVSISMCEDAELIIPDGFSPNGDGTNDDFDIVNIRQLFPNFALEIFNRYGNVLYKGTSDTPNWDGRSNESSGFGNSILPVGVYFYILEFNDGQKKPLQGRVYLSR